MPRFESFAARGLLAMGSGAIYSLAFPPVGLRFMIFIGIAGLLIALRGMQGTKARVIGFLHGMSAYAIGLSWLYHVFGMPVIALWVILATFTAVFAHGQGMAESRGLTGWRFAMFTTLNWSAWEFIRAEIFPLKFPWMTAGLAIGPNALLPWIGVYGVSSLVILTVSFVIFRLCKFAWIPALAIMTACVVNRPLTDPAASDPSAIRVAGLQFEGVSIDTFINTTAKLPDDVRHVVWPEYSIAYVARGNSFDGDLIQLCRQRDITLTFGTQTSPKADGGWWNIAETLDGTGIRGRHAKVHPVHFFDDGTPGTTAVPVETQHGKIGTPICFDCDYEGVIRKMTAAGAEAFMVPTMDADHWTKREHEQHAELFRIRACENRRWIFECATSGVSQIVDPHGAVHARLGPLEQGVLVGTLRRESGLTFYTRCGWVTPWVVLAAAVAMWIWVLIRKKVQPSSAWQPEPNLS